jgi:hypothetical protein
MLLVASLAGGNANARDKALACAIDLIALSKLSLHMRDIYREYTVETLGSMPEGSTELFSALRPPSRRFAFVRPIALRTFARLSAKVY